MSSATRKVKEDLAQKGFDWGLEERNPSKFHNFLPLIAVGPKFLIYFAAKPEA